MDTHISWMWSPKHHLFILMVTCTHETWSPSSREVAIILFQQNSNHWVVSLLILLRFISHTLVSMSAQIHHIYSDVMTTSQFWSISINNYHISCLIPVVIKIVSLESGCVILTLSSPMAQWIRPWSTKQEIPGSNPSRNATKDFLSHKIEIDIH